MKKQIFSLLLCAAASIGAARSESIDSTRTFEIDKVAIRANAKETAVSDRLPSATSVITPAQIESRGLDRLKQISAIVPNLFVADYGSPLSTPIYIRGIGTRGSGQSVGIYVDNVPLMDKSLFDTRLVDVRSIQVLRGPQGTLYGRNAMGGVINIYTPSGLDSEATEFMVSGGSYGTWSARGAHRMKLGKKVGLSLGGSWQSTDGYFTNEYTGKKVDKRSDASGRLRLDWQISDRWRAGFAASYEWTDGGAFAYGLYDKETDKVAPVRYNDKGSYARQSSVNSLNVQYNDDRIQFTSTTSYQWLKDNMWMDQDFTDKSTFTINQRQNMHAVTQEFAVRSIDKKQYQWSVGAFGFYNSLNTTGDVKFGTAGVQDILQKQFDKIGVSNPRAPKITITDPEIPNPGVYNTPSVGAAIFHQSTVNDLFTPGLSFTVGLRLDYEKQWLNYDTQMAMNLNISMPAMGNRPPISQPYRLDTTLMGNRSQQFFEWLPRVSLRYECTEDIVTWITASKGHRTGGYNVQMFSEVSQNALQQLAPMGDKPPAVDIDKTVSYRPEITWNYEFGTRARLFNGVWTMEAAVFYMDIRDLQLTQFINGGSGRILTNAGRGSSYGVEFASIIRPVAGLSIDVNYGYTHAEFSDYKASETIDYSGNRIPYTPKHTFSLGASYNLPLRGWLNEIILSSSVGGAGSIKWTEAGDVTQPFYALLDAKVGFRKGIVTVELWGRNLTNTDYGAFYFESFKKSYVQQGRPLTWGVNVGVKF